MPLPIARSLTAALAVLALALASTAAAADQPSPPASPKKATAPAWFSRLSGCHRHLDKGDGGKVRMILAAEDWTTAHVVEGIHGGKGGLWLINGPNAYFLPDPVINNQDLRTAPPLKGRATRLVTEELGPVYVFAGRAPEGGVAVRLSDHLPPEIEVADLRVRASFPPGLRRDLESGLRARISSWEQEDPQESVDPNELASKDPIEFKDMSRLQERRVRADDDAGAEGAEAGEAESNIMGRRAIEARRAVTTNELKARNARRLDALSACRDLLRNRPEHDKVLDGLENKIREFGVPTPNERQPRTNGAKARRRSA